MTPPEIFAINQRAADLESADLQALVDNIRHGSAGEASSIPRAINPNTSRRIKWLKVFDWQTGAWADLDGGIGGGRGPDFVSQIAWMAAIDDEEDGRERAAQALRDWLDRRAVQAGAPPAPRFRAAELAPARVAASHRSLRRE